MRLLQDFLSGSEGHRDASAAVRVFLESLIAFEAEHSANEIIDMTARRSGQLRLARKARGEARVVGDELDHARGQHQDTDVAALVLLREGLAAASEAEARISLRDRRDDPFEGVLARGVEILRARGDERL